MIPSPKLTLPFRSPKKKLLQHLNKIQQFHKMQLHLKNVQLTIHSYRSGSKWQKYDLDDVNEHHISSTGNRHALNDFLRTRVKPSTTKETDEEEIQSAPIFKRPMNKKQILTDDNDEDNQFISIRAPLLASTTENDNDEESTQYKLSSIRKKARGVVSTTEKKSIKSSIELPEDKGNDGGDDDDINDEFFEP